MPVMHLQCVIQFIEFKTLTEEKRSLTAARDSLVEEKAAGDLDACQLKIELTASIERLSSDLELTQQKLASKEETESKARDELRKATELNNDVSLFLNLSFGFSFNKVTISLLQCGMMSCDRLVGADMQYARIVFYPYSCLPSTKRSLKNVFNRLRS